MSIHPEGQQPAAGVDYGVAYNLILQAGGTPEEAALLAAIAGPESGYNPRAHNPNASTGDNSYGLWQINMLGNMGVNRAKLWGLSSYDQLFDPATNAKAALAILHSQGPKAWTTYTSGAYKKYANGTVAPSGGTTTTTTVPASTDAAAPPTDSLGSRLESILGIIQGKAL